MKCNDIEKEKERRDKISKKMKENFKNGVIKGWSHINENKNRRSYPEEFFLKVFEQNDFFHNYTIVEKLPHGIYVIDFLLVELKIIIEIDGEQHYRTTKNIEHDKKRDEYFLNEGFKVYRIRWRDVFNNTKDEIQELKNFIHNNNSSFRKYSLEEISYNKKTRKKKKTKKCNNCDNLILSCSNLCRECWKGSTKNSEIKERKKRVPKKNRICVKCNEEIYGDELCNKCNGLKNRKVERPSYDVLLDDINKMSLSAVGRKYGVTHNAIKKWIKNYEK